jgi:hypothetical protein
MISLFMGIKSIDYVLKRYLNDTDYAEGDSTRLDLRIATETANAMNAFSEALLDVSAIPNKRLGESIGELTVLRAPFGMQILISCAHRGALFEPLAIARMMLEQLAWAAAAAKEMDDNRIAKIGAEASIGALRAIVPEAGPFYGWLSAHAHWRYEAQMKGITVDEGRSGHLFASYYFKALSMAASLVLTSIYLRYMELTVVENTSSVDHSSTHLEKLRGLHEKIESLFSDLALLAQGDEAFSSLAVNLA